MSPGLVDYISRALVKPAEQRSGLAELMAHPWILEHARWGLQLVVFGLTALTRTALTRSVVGFK
jgi:hypothetical protein